MRIFKQSKSARVILFLLLGLLAFPLFQNFSDPSAIETLSYSSLVLNKKGIGASQFVLNKGTNYAYQRVMSFNPTWYYTWDADPLRNSDGTNLIPNIEFVPMIWNAGVEHPNPDSIFSISSDLKRLQQSVTQNGKPYKHLLLFNEPDHGKINATSASIAAHLIYSNLNQIQNLSAKIISPAMANYPVKRKKLFTADLAYSYDHMPDYREKWLDSFLARLTKGLAPSDSLDPFSDTELKQAITDSKNLNSSIAIHLYPDPVFLGIIPETPTELSEEQIETAAAKVTAHFLNTLHLIYQKYRRPIWITEFNVADWEIKFCDKPIEQCPKTNRIATPVVIRFLKKVLPELQSRTYVVRYSLFVNAIDFGEQLRTAAAFENKYYMQGSTKVYTGVKLTKIGEIYRDFNGEDIKCVKGEYINKNGLLVEYRQNCALEVNPWVTDQGWIYDRSNKTYFRVVYNNKSNLFVNWNQLTYFEPKAILPRCEELFQVCKDAGYYYNGYTEGKGLVHQCVKPIMQGQSVADIRTTFLREEVQYCLNN